MDGVLINSMPSHWRAWQQACRRQHLRITRQEIYRREGERGIVTAGDILRANGRPAGRDAIRRLVALKERRFQRSRRRVRPFAGAGKLLRWCRERTLALALVTGTSRGELVRVLPESWLRCFGAVITADDVRRGKPFPDPYRAALRRLRMPARACLVIENAPFGITAARRAGLSRIIALTTSLPPKALHQADHIVASHRQALRLLERFVNG